MSRDRRGFKRVAGQLITGNKVREFVCQTLCIIGCYIADDV